MEKKTFQPRRSSTLLRRAAALAVLMLAAQTALWAYTVTLKAGSRGTGSDIVINSGDEANMAANQGSAAHGQFWMEGDQLWFRFPDCPASFTAPEGEILLGWYVGEESGSPFSPGFVNKITKDLVLIAKWGKEEFNEGNEDYNITYAVTSKSPLEVKMTSIDLRGGTVLTIPATVDHDWEIYTVVEIGDEVCKSDGYLTTLTMPATVRRIGKEAFSQCFALTTLTFEEGSQLTAMGQDAFAFCSNLHTIYNIQGSIKSEGGNLFNDCSGIQEVTIWGNRRIGTEEWGIIMNAQSVTVTLPANEADGAYWTTFYNENYHFKADGNTTVYKATLSGDALLLHEVEDRIIKWATGVILKSTGNPVLTKNETKSKDEAETDLKGSDYDQAPGPGTYVLYGGAQGLGFYPFSGTTLQGGKAYITISSGGSVRGYVGMSQEPTVGTVGIQHHADTRQAAEEAAEGWFTLDGRALLGRPATPGLYIQKGRKVMIK